MSVLVEVFKKYRNVVILSAAAILFTLGSAASSGVRSLYLITNFGDTFFGVTALDILLLLLTLFLVPVLWPIMGRISDRFGRKKTITLSLFLYSLLAFLYPGIVVISLWGYSFIFSLLSAMRIPASNALIADSVWTNRRGTAFGAISGLSFLVAIVGPAIGSAIFAGWGYTAVFYSCAIIILLGAVLVLLLLREPGPVLVVKNTDKKRLEPLDKNRNADTLEHSSAKNEDVAKGQGPELDSGTWGRMVVLLIVVSFVLGSVVGQTRFAFSFVTVELGNIDIYQNVVTCFSLLLAFSIVLGGVLADIHGRMQVVSTTLKFGIPVTLLMLLTVPALNFWFLLILASTIIFLLGMVPPAILAMMADITPPSKRGMTYGFLGLGELLGSLGIIMLTDLLAFGIYGLAGIQAFFALTLILLVLTAIIVHKCIEEPEAKY